MGLSNIDVRKLKEVRDLLEEEFRLLSDEQFNERRKEDEWSIAQVCHHLVLVEQSAISAVNWGLNKGELGSVEKKNVQAVAVRKNKMKAPRIVEPDEKTFTVEEMVNLLNESREKLMQLLESIEDSSVLKEKSAKHAAFGSLTLDQWIEFIPYHEERHIEQIKEIKKELTVS